MMKMTDGRPYGKRERLAHWKAAHSAELVSAIRISRIAAQRTFKLVAIRTAMQLQPQRRSLVDWGKAKLLDLKAKVWCWAIENKLWSKGTELDYKLEESIWATIVLSGPKLCQRAA